MVDDPALALGGGGQEHFLDDGRQGGRGALDSAASMEKKKQEGYF